MYECHQSKTSQKDKEREIGRKQHYQTLSLFLLESKKWSVSSVDCIFQLHSDRHQSESNRSLHYDKILIITSLSFSCRGLIYRWQAAHLWLAAFEPVTMALGVKKKQISLFWLILLIPSLMTPAYFCFMGFLWDIFQMLGLGMAIFYIYKPYFSTPCTITPNTLCSLIHMNFPHCVLNMCSSECTVQPTFSIASIITWLCVFLSGTEIFWEWHCNPIRQSCSFADISCFCLPA